MPFRYEAWPLPGSATFEKKFDIPEALSGSSGVRELSDWSDGTLFLPASYSNLSSLVSETVGSLIRVYLGATLVDEFDAARVERSADRPGTVVVSGPQRNGLVEGIATLPRNYPEHKEGALHWKWGAENVIPSLPLGSLGSIREVWEVYHDHTSGSWNAQVGVVDVDIAFDATAAQVEGFSETLSPPGSGLQGLTSVNDVTVSGEGTAAKPYIITFFDPPDPTTVTLTVGTLSGGSTFSATKTTEGQLDPSPVTISKPVDAGVGDTAAHGTYDNPALQVNLQAGNIDTGADWSARVNALTRYAGCQLLVDVTPGETYSNIKVRVKPNTAGDFTLVIHDIYENRIARKTDVALTAGTFQDLTINTLTIPAGVEQVIVRVAATDATPANIDTFWVNWQGATMLHGEPESTFTEILTELLAAATDRGAGTWLELDASAAADSLGTALTDINFTAHVGDKRNLSHVLGDGKAIGYQWDVVPAADALVITPAAGTTHVLQIYYVDADEIEDLTASLGGPSVLTGSHVKDAQLVTRRAPYTTLIGLGAGAVSAEDTNATAEAGIGRVEQVRDVDHLASSTSVQSFLDASFAEEARNRNALSATVLESAGKVPLVDYGPGSKIWWQFPGIHAKEARPVKRIGYVHGAVAEFQLTGSRVLSGEAAMASALDRFLRQPGRRRDDKPIPSPTQLAGGGLGVPAFFIAASDASPQDKAVAWKTVDGTADDVEIQAAIDALPSTERGRVYLSGGTFYIANTITISNRTVHIHGVGYGTMVRAAGSVSPFFQVNEGYVEISDMRVFGDSDPSDTANTPPITYTYSSKFVDYNVTNTASSRTHNAIRRCHIDRFELGIITTNANSRDRWLRFENNIVWRCDGTNGVIALTGTLGDGISIQENLFRNNNVRPVYANDNYSGIVTDNIFINSSGTAPNVVGTNLDAYHNRAEDSAGETYAADHEHGSLGGGSQAETVTTAGAPKTAYAYDQPGWYDPASNRTYVAYLGLERDLYVTYKDHQTGAWASAVEVANYPLADDNDHGAPSVTVGNDGTIHVIWGAHNTVLKHSKSNNPWDISAWTTGNVDANEGTYPSIQCDRSTGNLYIIARAGTGASHTSPFPTHAYGSLRISTNNGASWSSQAAIVDTTGAPESATDFYPIGGTAFYDGKLHFAWTVARGTVHDDVRTNVYHAYYDPSDGNLYTAGGTSLGTSIDWTDHTSCLAATRNPIGQLGLAVAQGRILIIYTAGTDDLFATVWGGSSWTDTDLSITTPSTEESRATVWPVADGWRGAFPVLNGSFGDVVLYGSLDGVTWASIGTLFSGASGEGYSRVAPIRGGGPLVALTLEDATSHAITSATASDLLSVYAITDTLAHDHNDLYYTEAEVDATIAALEFTKELVMQDGVTAPPVPVETEARDDWLYQD